MKSFVDVGARARELGCRVPVVIALLPGNFSTAANAGEFRYHPATPYIRSAWQRVNMRDEGPSGAGFGDQGSGVSSGIRTPAPNPQPLAPSVSTNVPLAVFFGPGLLLDAPDRLTVALAMVLRVFANDPHCASPRDVPLDVVVERPGGNGCACVEYRGDACELSELARAVREVWAGE